MASLTIGSLGKAHLAGICEASKDTGTCKQFSTKWFFNKVDGTCNRFHYGGGWQIIDFYSCLDVQDARAMPTALTRSRSAKTLAATIEVELDFEGKKLRFPESDFNCRCLPAAQSDRAVCRQNGALLLRLPLQAVSALPVQRMPGVSHQPPPPPPPPLLAAQPF
jgi:hypothetical protein